MSPTEPGQVSVVIASIVGAPFIDGCLASIEKQSLELGAEVIVVARGTDRYAERIQRQFPWVRVIHRQQRETVPELRRIGVEQASGGIVAIIEEHCVAREDWLRQAMAGHERGSYGAVGGPIADSDYRSLQDWVVYFCEYNGHLPPASNSEVWDLNGANIAYRRQLLLDHSHLLAGGYWETSLHPTLLAQGTRFLSIPEMVVYHRGPFGYRYYLHQRYLFSRAFAGARAGTLQRSRKAAYLLGAPLIPGLLLARMGSRVWRKRHHVGTFALSLPLLIPALAAYVAGEWVGYLAGPGDALSKVE